MINTALTLTLWLGPGVFCFALWLIVVTAEYASDGDGPTFEETVKTILACLTPVANWVLAWSFAKELVRELRVR